MTWQFHSYNIHRNVATHNDKDESHKYNIERKKPDKTEILYDSIYIKFQTLYYIRLKLIVLNGQRLYLWEGADGEGHQGMMVLLGKW